MSTQQEKSVPWKEEKAPAEKSVTPAKQEVLQFEPVTRGRFEKSEPTIIEGEDLDVPDLSAETHQGEVTSLVRRCHPERSEAQSRIPQIA